MSATISFTEVDVFTSIRGMLQTFLPTTTEIIRAQVNRTPEPSSTDFIVMTQISRTHLWTKSLDVYEDDFTTGGLSLVNVTMPVELVIQLDVHGPSSAESVQIVLTLFNDEYATGYFDRGGIDLQALYAGDPRQVPFKNAEDQWETRWTIDLCLQANQVVTLPQQFFDTVSAGLINVDVVYPP